VLTTASLGTGVIGYASNQAQESNSKASDPRLVFGDGQRWESMAMSANEVDWYLADVDEPKRSTLAALRRSILEVVPKGEQCISYGVPAFKVHGNVVAGFAAFKSHLSYLRHSGSVLSALGNEVAELRPDERIAALRDRHAAAKRLVRKLIKTRLHQLGLN
jgi:uncharacterized protein YdhG (YjbR/CyaY superfamily)